MQKLQLAAVSLGRLGRYHAETLACRLPNATVKAVCSIDQREIDDFYRQFPAVLSYQRGYAYSFGGHSFFSGKAFVGALKLP